MTARAKPNPIPEPDRLVAATRAPKDRFYGDRDGPVIDPFGQGWLVPTHVEDVAAEETGRRPAAMFEQG